MSLTSENERAEQIWSGWNKFPVEQISSGADVGTTVWRIAYNLEKTLLCNFYFRGQKF